MLIGHPGESGGEHDEEEAENADFGPIEDETGHQQSGADRLQTRAVGRCAGGAVNTTANQSLST